MRPLISIFLLLAAVSAKATPVHEVFMEVEHWQGLHCTFESLEDVKRKVEHKAQSRCTGELNQVSEWIQVVDKPIGSFCYPRRVLAVFECLN